MKKNSKTTPAPAASKIDPAFEPKARVLIKKIKAKLEELKTNSSAKKSTPKKKPASPPKKGKAAKPAKKR